MKTRNWRKYPSRFTSWHDAKTSKVDLNFFYRICPSLHIPRHVTSASARPHFRSSALAWRHTSSNCVIHNTFVVPAKWLCHFGHVNRFHLLTYLLTYLLTSLHKVWKTTSVKQKRKVVSQWLEVRDDFDSTPSDLIVWRPFDSGL